MIGSEVAGADLSGPDIWAWAFRALKAAARAPEFDLSAGSVRGVLAQLDDAAVRRVALALALAPKYALPGDASERVVDKVALDLSWRWS